MNLANIEGEKLLLRAFITGLPDEISKQLRAQVKIFGISLQDALNHARVLMTEKTKKEYVSTTISEFHRNVKKLSATDVICYNCGKPGHICALAAVRFTVRWLRPTIMLEVGSELPAVS